MKQKTESVGRGLVLAALDQFPNAGNQTIAEFLHRNNPLIFKSKDLARGQVRYYRGANGVRDRARVTVTKHVRPVGAAGKSFPDLPEGITSFEDWGSLKIDGPAKVLILSDLHVPYHASSVIKEAVEQGKDADLVILNGDVIDCYEQSSFNPDPRKCNFAGALRTTRELIEWLRAKFPKARMLLKEGNHEERLERYFTTRAPAVLGCEEFELQSLLKLGSYGVEWLGEKRPIRLGKLHIIHGHEFRAAFSNPVNPARGLFLRAKVHSLEGHYHQPSQHSERDLTGSVISTWSTGCLCDLHPEYAPINSWAHGAAYVEVDAQGAFNVDNFRIVNGKAY